MVETVIKTFKLNFDGTFDEIAYEHIKEVFTIVSILAIYITNIKTMYIWIGKNAAQALKNHIPNIRVIIKEIFPQFRIIRNITFDMRSEPLEFFNNLNLSKDELYEIINYQEKTVIPILEKVDDLKEKSDYLIKSEQYIKAIDLLKEIIELAKKIQDDALVTEQKRSISELTEKNENKKIVSEIEEETTKIERKYNDLVNTNKILEAHNLIESFIKKYETIYDLSLIPKTKELILKENRKWKSEQEKLRNNIMRLENDLNFSLENLDLSKAREIFEKGLELLSNLTDKKIKIKWEELQKKINYTKVKVDFIERFNLFSKNLDKLKQNYQFNELKLNIEALIKQLGKIDLPEYHDKLDFLKNEINSAEQAYDNINKEINELEDKIKKNRKNNIHLKDVVKDSNKLIALANSINKAELAESYNKILELTKRKINEIKEFEEKQKKLKVELSKLEENFNLSLRAMDIKILNDILEKGSILLSEIVDNNLKTKWNDYKSKFTTVKLLLEKIDALSKNGMEALNKGSCSDSLGFFEQIIIQLQNYGT